MGKDGMAKGHKDPTEESFPDGSRADTTLRGGKKPNHGALKMEHPHGATGHDGQNPNSGIHQKQKAPKHTQPDGHKP